MRYQRKHTPSGTPVQTALERSASAPKHHAHAPACASVAAALLASPAAQGTPEPYTLARHISNFQPGTKAPRQFVQVRDYGYRHTRCAVIRDLWTSPDGTDLWIVDLVDGGRMHAHPSRTTQCSRLDGRCICAGESPRPSIVDADGKAAD